MNVSVINNSQPNFNGKVITKGKWTASLKKSFLENEEIKKAASGKYDIIGHMSRKKASLLPKVFSNCEPIYKLQIEARPESPTILERVKSFLGLVNVAEVSKNHHSETITEYMMETRIKAEHLAKYLNIKL